MFLGCLSALNGALRRIRRQPVLQIHDGEDELRPCGLRFLQQIVTGKYTDPRSYGNLLFSILLLMRVLCAGVLTRCTSALLQYINFEC